eukprot:6197258-Pleurochrysis_carterae.AAC.2
MLVFYALCCAFSQVAEWKALFGFYEEHQTADVLPQLPVSLNVSRTATESRSMDLTGMPISWNTMWSKLAGRFSRPHHTRTSAYAAGSNNGEGVGSGADFAARTERTSAAEGAARPSTAEPELPLPPLNNVMIINHPPSARQAGKAQHQT